METPAQTGFSPTDLAYTAGIVDGEGCISAHLKLRNSYGEPANLLRISVGVGNTDHDLTHWLQDMFGGEWHLAKNPARQKHPTWKPISIWKIGGNRAGDFLEMVYPYMRVKRAQAEIAIALVHLLLPRSGEGRWRGVPQENREHRELLVDELRRLNNYRRRAEGLNVNYGGPEVAAEEEVS